VSGIGSPAFMRWREAYRKAKADHIRAIRKTHAAVRADVAKLPENHSTKDLDDILKKHWTLDIILPHGVPPMWDPCWEEPKP